MAMVAPCIVLICGEEELPEEPPNREPKISVDPPGTALLRTRHLTVWSVGLRITMVTFEPARPRIRADALLTSAERVLLTRQSAVLLGSGVGIHAQARVYNVTRSQWAYPCRVSPNGHRSAQSHPLRACQPLPLPPCVNNRHSRPGARLAEAGNNRSEYRARSGRDTQEHEPGDDDRDDHPPSPALQHTPYPRAVVLELVEHQRAADREGAPRRHRRYRHAPRHPRAALAEPRHCLRVTKPGM